MQTGSRAPPSPPLSGRERTAVVASCGRSAGCVPSLWRIEGFFAVTDEAIPNPGLDSDDRQRRHDEEQNDSRLRIHRLHQEPHLWHLEDHATCQLLRSEGPRIDSVVGVAFCDHHAVVIEPGDPVDNVARSEEHTSELQSREKLVCRLLLEKKKKKKISIII